MWIQKSFSISSHSRGFHLITDDVLRNTEGIKNIKIGILHLFIKHTSASLTINEDADPTVRADFESHFNQIVPENQPYYKHTFEGSDDMPAHIKTSLLDTSLSIPISNGKLVLGTWQGIYLCEHRNHGGNRNFVATAYGE
ncbi:MAG TPA: secondary thiamine-phosphate synthase enzyme YjbQ [Candidatus Marinimicrobia bacterium]|jgi:secondary thiamine-phosphate synthase enzyme|nr:secondary thiamine-phosphate synthase enzyme YjbQ [Candidatus Neomarinimicrobiota bacterium]|tara:strand:+ start:199 stop:618 length:420 start_codon:yes stop_codon:yes gene_type:complete